MVNTPIRVLTSGDTGVGKRTLTRRLLSALGHPTQIGVRFAEKRSENHYRFPTEGREFIVTDLPGSDLNLHNMATTALAGDLVIVVADARKGILWPTLRHAHIAAIFGIRSVILAVNQANLASCSEEVFRSIENNFIEKAKAFGFLSISCIPVSATSDENLTTVSEARAWYRGPSLLAALEEAQPRNNEEEQPFRILVSNVDTAQSDFRRYSGIVAAGNVRLGQKIIAPLSEKFGKIVRIVASGSDLTHACSGDSVTLTINKDLQANCGDLIVDGDLPIEVSDQLRATVLWLDDKALLPSRTYEINVAGQMTYAAISDLRYEINVDTMEHVAARTLEAGEIGVCNIALERPLVFDPFDQVRQTGSFELIDQYDKRIVGAGTITFGLRRATNITRQTFDIDKHARAALKNQKPCVLWFTGFSGAGKTTVANHLEAALHQLGRHTQLLDGDNIRHALNRDLGFTEADRVENIRRIAEVSKLSVEAGLIVIVSFISPFRSEREMARNLLSKGEFFEVFIDTPFEICEARDPKGLYNKARLGQITNFTGIDSPYEPPEEPEFRITTADMAPDAAADALISYLQERGKIW